MLNFNKNNNAFPHTIEPNCQQNEICLEALKYVGMANYRLNDANCNNMNYFFCQRKSLATD